MTLLVFICVFFISLCNCSDVFHEGSKITFYPNYRADFFGYAVAFHESRLLVGAPKATIKSVTDTLSSGAVFNCPLQNLEVGKIYCTLFKLGYKGGSQRHFIRNDTWFGASLAVGPTGKLVICAPRWSRPIQGLHSLVATSNGACYLWMKRREGFIFPSTNVKQGFYANYIRNDYSDYNRYSNTTQLEFYTFAQAGMATKITEGNIIIGAPGLMEWSGGIIQYAYNPDVNSISYSQKPTYNPFFTDEIGPDEYFGYSVESAIFEDGGNILYVTGGPKGKQGFGVVLVLEPPTITIAPLNILAKLEGPQLGAYFGASLSCLDVNGDGRIDLLVGAPNYVKWFDRDLLYDQGAVFVYLNKEQAKGFNLEYVGHVTGSEANGAKFGYGIADLGDIDADGYNDVVISAPWENNGVGAVYIYRGNKEGLKSQYMQRIVASEAKSFGIGLTKGRDVDSNKCNDLVVGAHDSGTAYIYRCIPTVKVQATIKIPEMLSLPHNTTNFTAQFCLNVLPLRIHSTTIMIELQATVTVDPEGNRATIPGNSIYNVSATPPFDNCESKMIELKPAADLSRPIAIIFEVESTDRMKDNPTQFLITAGRVSTDSTMHSEFNIQLARGCGEDLICRPCLEMTLEAMSEPYIPGAEGRLGAIIRVLNKEEPAFGIRINLTLPSPPKRVPSTCNLQGLNMTCVLPSPLNQNQTAVWEVEFEYIQDMREMGITMITADIDDPVAGRNVSDHASQYLQITIKPIAIISASGKALPNATLTVTREKLTEGGRIPLIHYFQVINAGPSGWPDLRAVILVSETYKKVSLASEIADCGVENQINASLALRCVWSVKAKESLSVVLPLRFDLAENGKSLEAHTTCNVTTTLYLSLEDKVLVVSVTTTLVLEPAPPYWIAIIVGTVIGLLLLLIISYVVHKCGFLSRKRHPGYKKLPSDTAAENAGCSSSFQSSPQPTAANGSNEKDSSEPGCSSTSNHHSSLEPTASDATNGDLSKPSYSSSVYSSPKPTASNGSNTSYEDISKPSCSSSVHSSPKPTASNGSNTSNEDLSKPNC